MAANFESPCAEDGYKTLMLDAREIGMRKRLRQNCLTGRCAGISVHRGGDRT